MDNQDYERLYRELRAAVRDYFESDAPQAQMTSAYSVIIAHATSTPEQLAMQETQRLEKLMAERARSVTRTNSRAAMRDYASGRRGTL